MSLYAKGIPSRGPRASPDALRLSDSNADAVACSVRKDKTASVDDCHASRADVEASQISTAETFPSLKALARSEIVFTSVPLSRNLDKREVFADRSQE